MTDPVINLILTEQSLPTLTFSAGREPLRAGVTAVYATEDGSVHFLGRPLKWGEASMRKYRTRYEVGLADHELDLTMTNELPSYEEAFRFNARVNLGFRVHDPAEVVHRRITNGLAVVRSRLLDVMRDISRKHTIRDYATAQRQINDRLGSGDVVLREGITVYWFSAFLSLDDATRQADSNLREARTAAALETERIAALDSAWKGELGLLKLHLTRHPDATHDVLQLVAQAEQTSVQGRLDLLKSMMDANLIQDVDIEDIRDESLRNLLNIVRAGGSGLLSVSSPAAPALAKSAAITGELAPQSTTVDESVIATSTPAANGSAPSTSAVDGANVTMKPRHRRPATGDGTTQ